MLEPIGGLETGSVRDRKTKSFPVDKGRDQC
jgi:hypothetical protein